MIAAPRPVPIRPVDLPAEVRKVLRLITADLRNLPRDCIVDRAELLHWLNRMARRVEGIERMQVRGEPPPAKGPPALLARPPAALSPKQAGEAVFSSQSLPAASVRPRRRTITSRRDKQVQVENRQLNFWG